MKKLLSLSAGILFTAMLSAQAIPNGGFENWSNVNWYDLNGYQSSNDQNISKGFGFAGYNAVRSSTAEHGNYAIQLSTVQVGADTLFAYITNGIQNPLQGLGGIPYSQKPTGIRLYYKCNINAGDTAGVMVIFKKHGMGVIGTYLYPFITTTGSYTLFANTFAPALPATPDTVIFAALSSVQAMFDNNNSKGCKPGNTITIDSVTFTGGVSQPANMNGDFENWTADTGYVPTGWYSSYPGVFQTTDFHAGSYAAQLTTNNNPNNGPEPGVISTGPFYNGGNNAGGYPYTNTADTFEFYYKYSPAVAGDSGFVGLNFKKSGSSVGFTGMELKPEAAYTLVKLGFTTGVPDSVIVTFVSSKTSNPPASYIGSVLKVDNAFFKSQQATDLGVNKISSEVTGISVYPNPFDNSFNLNTEGFSGSVQTVEVYDMTGRMITSVDNASSLNNTITSIDMSRTSPGIYIVKVLTSTGVFYQKISKIE